MDHKYSAAAGALGGSSAAPKKEIKEISVKKSHNGGHVITHKHHSPEHHPDETHTTKGNDEMAAHMLQHAGDPSDSAAAAGGASDPAEAAGEPGSAAAPMTAAPSAPGAAMPAPTAGA
jgi:hypothetical protein